MTDEEFDVLDALYFVTPFDKVVADSGLEAGIVKSTLEGLVDKGWVRCYRAPDEEVAASQIQFSAHYAQYHYLATKAGLLAHNGR